MDYRDDFSPELTDRLKSFRDLKYHKYRSNAYETVVNILTLVLRPTIDCLIVKSLLNRFSSFFQMAGKHIQARLVGPASLSFHILHAVGHLPIDTR